VGNGRDGQADVVHGWAVRLAGSTGGQVQRERERDRPSSGGACMRGARASPQASGHLQ
jgi:hypothetical protein